MEEAWPACATNPPTLGLAALLTSLANSLMLTAANAPPRGEHRSAAARAVGAKGQEASEGLSWARR